MKSMEEMIQAAQRAAETIQQQMADAQGRLDAIEVEGVAGGGLVRIRTSAKGRVIAVMIDESLLQPAEKGIVEDLVAAAFNDARTRADAAAAEEMQRVRFPPGSSCRSEPRLRPRERCTRHDVAAQQVFLTIA